MKTYQQTYKVVASDMDITYHMTPNAILLYFQDCFARCLTERRLAAFDVIKQNLLWMITELDFNFVGERPLWSDNIRVEVWFSEISSIRIYVNYRIYDNAGKVFVEGSSCWIILNALTKRPFAPGQLLKEAGFEGEETPVHNLSLRKIQHKQLFMEEEHQVNVMDLDFNGHVCNRSYLSIAMATAPMEFIQKNVLKHLYIHFVREAFFKEVLKCNVYKVDEEENVFYHSIVNSQGKEICQIYSEWKADDKECQQDVADLINRKSPMA